MIINNKNTSTKEGVVVATATKIAAAAKNNNTVRIYIKLDNKKDFLPYRNKIHKRKKEEKHTSVILQMSP